MKFQEMQNRVIKIKQLQEDLEAVDLLCNFTSFSSNDIEFNFNRNPKEAGFAYASKTTFNKLISPDLIKALAFSFKIQIEKEIEELEK